MMTTRPEDAMTRERAMEEAAQQHEKEARRYEATAQESDEREDEPSMTEGDCARFIAETHRSAAATIRALASAQQEPAPAADEVIEHEAHRLAAHVIPAALIFADEAEHIEHARNKAAEILKPYVAAARAKSGEKDGTR